jgi:signal transduction histidine kinase
MRTLYTRIVLTLILIALVSSILALVLSNVYLGKIREDSEIKILNIGNEIRMLYEQMPDVALDDYLSHIANMGFQIYLVDDQWKDSFYGAPFKNQKIEQEQIRRVLEGETYHGIMQERHLLLINGFFENSISNSIGLPLLVKGRTYALFVRPDLVQQIGEVRILLALLLGYSFLFSIVLIVVLSQYIVKPVKKLTEATHKIVSGDYNIVMDVSRQDEIGNLARDFTKMAHSLKQLDEMRQEFVANVSHEIQSPLTSIQGFAGSILDGEATPEEVEQYLRIIEQESRRLSSLSKQLLTLATLDKEEIVLKLSAFRLDEQIRQILIVSEWQWTEKQLLVELDLPEVVITADPQLLYRVWLNLITNSIKFSRSGATIGIKIRVKHDVIVEISDTGIGIPKSELPHIFERFYKVDKARDRTRSGSGLGLSIVQKIIGLHQGSIDVQSEMGIGTTMTVRLPHL